MAKEKRNPFDQNEVKFWLDLPQKDLFFEGLAPEPEAESIPKPETRRSKVHERNSKGSNATEEKPNSKPVMLSPGVEGFFEVRPIGTPLGFKELAALHKRTWDRLGVTAKKVQTILWPLALHFGLYWIKQGEEKKRPPLVGAFWARALSDAPLTLGHLYPPVLFKGLLANDVYEFGGMVIDPELQKRGLVKTLADAARIFLFSRRPELIITTPIEPLYEIYKHFGLKCVGDKPIEHPHSHGVTVYLMYGKFRELAGPYFM